jgi:membrane protease YdiL (CAAX protease family)
MHDAPAFPSYFAFPFWLRLEMLVAALVEEIAWRGFLQPRFVRRYGVGRGIFLLALAWGAFHFSFDIRLTTAPEAIVLTILYRLYMATAVSYVLGWLTIRSRSVLPAALAHGFYNIFLFIPGETPGWVILALWAACGWILFRYFPVHAADESVAAEPGPTLEPAI